MSRDLGKIYFNKFLKIFVVFLIIFTWIFSGWPQVWQEPPVPPEIKIVKASPDIENLWSESNSVSSDLTLTNSANANGSTTGNWADAKGKWAKAPYEYWEFVMGDSTHTEEAINSVTLYLKHYQSGWADDDFNIDIYDGSTWTNVKSYTKGSGPPTSDTTNNWDVKALGIDTWTKINAAKVRIIGNGQSGAEDTVDWFVDTVELRIDYTPANQAPTVSNVSLNGGANIDLTENTTTTVECTATSTDANGGDDITSATSTIYRSGVGSGCVANDNNCYRLPSADCSLGTPVGNDRPITCTAQIWFHADPTDAGTYSGEIWSCEITATDSGSLTGSATNTTETIEMNTLLALDVTQNINYGTMASGQTIDPLDILAVATTTGNAAIDANISGTNMCTDYPTCAGNTIDIGQQRYATSSVAYASGYTATTTPTHLEFDTGKPTAHPSNQAQNTYWGIAVPAGQALGDYTGENTFTAVAD